MNALSDGRGAEVLRRLTTSGRQSEDVAVVNAGASAACAVAQLRRNVELGRVRLVRRRRSKAGVTPRRILV